MTNERKRFTVITNEELTDRENNEHKRRHFYQTNPLKEKLLRFTNEEGGKKFSVEDLLKW